MRLNLELHVLKLQIDIQLIQKKSALFLVVHRSPQIGLMSFPFITSKRIHTHTFHTVYLCLSISFLYICIYLLITKMNLDLFTLFLAYYIQICTSLFSQSRIDVKYLLFNIFSTHLVSCFELFNMTVPKTIYNQLFKLYYRLNIEA